MKQNITTLLLIFVCAGLTAQRHDAVWLMGYFGGNQSGPNDMNGLSIIRFDENNEITVENNQTCDMNFDGANSSFCDSSGQLLFFSNAEKIYNKTKHLMLNGNNINNTNQLGYVEPQGVLSLPIPNKNGKYLLTNIEDKYWSEEVSWAGYRIYQNIIDIEANNGLGAVIEKKTLIIEDTLEFGQITAVKHANGQDWWILVPESFTNRYYTILLDSSGMSVVDTQAVGDSFIDGVGQAVFSPDGTKYQPH